MPSLLNLFGKKGKNLFEKIISCSCLFKSRTDDKNGHLTITKETTSVPANGESYALGETIAYKITATNDGNLTITYIKVTDEMTGDEWTIDSLSPGESKEFTTDYVVTEADVLAGSVKNEATADGTSPDDEMPLAPVDPGVTEDPTEDKKGHLTIETVTTSAPANGKAYILGEQITYKITATNDGNLTITYIKVTDELTGDEWTIESLAPGESKEFTATYVVTEADVVEGEVLNETTAYGTSPDPDEPFVPVDPGVDPEPTEGGEKLVVEKIATNEPSNGETYALGEEIHYRITVRNEGSVTVKNIKVTDEMTGDLWNIDSLAPGESKQFEALHIITEADILAGEVTNEVKAEGVALTAE